MSGSICKHCHQPITLDIGIWVGQYEGQQTMYCTTDGETQHEPSRGVSDETA